MGVVVLIFLPMRERYPCTSLDPFSVIRIAINRCRLPSHLQVLGFIDFDYSVIHSAIGRLIMANRVLRIVRPISDHIEFLTNLGSVE